ncbi:MAG: IdeS/Mac family cysteine endopeptidase, partial [Akkermansia sp.]|nr:IdeS/Mac family cysteine endopeptidase [Akkermansia sp.]
DIGHAITLWGVEHEEGVIKALWITDSDDKKKALCRVETYTTDGGLLHLSTTGDYAYSYTSSEITVDTLFAIKPAVANAWLVENYGPVPEPATAMLILPGLVALAARRRRC